MNATVPTAIPTLWPSGLQVGVRTPLFILRVQAESLGKLTKGVLQGIVESSEGEDHVQHRLVVAAPAYNGYRHVVLAVQHQKNMPYPAEVQAEALKDVREVVDDMSNEYSTTEFPSAVSEEALLALVKRVLASDETTSLLSSLLANSNDAKTADAEG